MGIWAELLAYACLNLETVAGAPNVHSLCTRGCPCQPLILRLRQPNMQKRSLYVGGSGAQRVGTECKLCRVLWLLQGTSAKRQMRIFRFTCRAVYERFVVIQYAGRARQAPSTGTCEHANGVAYSPPTTIASLVLSRRLNVVPAVHRGQSSLACQSTWIFPRYMGPSV